MERIRIGNDIAISWALFENNGATHLINAGGASVSLNCGGYTYLVPSFSVQGNVVSFIFPAEDQVKTGKYKIVLTERNESGLVSSYDVRDAFVLVPENEMLNVGYTQQKNVEITSVITHAAIANIKTISIVESEEEGGDNVVTFVLTDGSQFPMTVKNGSKGDKGDKGDQGIQGEKGDKGDTGARGPAGIEEAEVSVDATTGTPSVEASIEDGVLSLAFSGIKGEKGDKGDKGNTGSSVDFPYELVTDVETDDDEKGLAASQGVVLDNKISQLGQQLQPNLYGLITDIDSKLTLSIGDLSTFEPYGVPIASTNRVFTTGYIHTPFRILVNSDYKIVRTFIYNKQIDGSILFNHFDSTERTSLNVEKNDDLYRIVLKKDDDSDFVESELGNIIAEFNGKLDCSLEPLYTKSGIFDSVVGYYDVDNTNYPYIVDLGYTPLQKIEKDYNNPILFLNTTSDLSKLIIYRENNGVYKNIFEQVVRIGVHKGVKIEHNLLRGDYVGISGNGTGGVRFVAGGEFIRVAGLNVSSFTVDDIIFDGAIHFAYGVANIVQLYDLEETKNEISSLIDKYNSISNFGGFRHIGLIKTTLFNSISLPDGWSNSGFTLSADGATPTTQGDLLQYPQNSDLNASCVSVTLDATTAFSLFIVRYGTQYPSSGGAVVGFDMVNKKLNLYQPSVQGVTPTTVVKSFDIPFDFVEGQYVLTIGNCAEYERFTIFGAGQRVDFYVDGKTITNWTRPHDNYGVLHNSGTYKVKQISFSSPLAFEPDVLIVGDSIAEADTIRLETNGGFENSWVGLLSKKTLLSLWAQGGNTSTNINADLSTLVSLFKPKKVVYAIGTNDTVFSTWESNCVAFTNAFENIGAEVIYTLPALRDDRETFLTTIRNWIKASGKRYIDFLSATTINGLGETRKQGYFLADTIHPTPLGHKAMYEAAITNIPDFVIY